MKTDHYKKRGDDWAMGEIPSGQTTPTREQVEAYIDCAEDELGPACGDPAAVWCAETLRNALTGTISKEPLAVAASYLNRLPWTERVSAISDLQNATAFCWDCGMDSDGKACHCKNDE